MSYTKNNKGSITLISLLFSLVILTVAIGFNYLVKMYLRNAFYLKERMDLELKVNSVLNETLYCIKMGSLDNKHINLSECRDFFKNTVIPLNGALTLVKDNIYLSIQDTNGLISLNGYNFYAIKRLLINQCNYSEKDADIFYDSYLDWIDKDDYERLNGAEKFYYTANGFNYQPRNYPIQYKQELTLIRGMTKNCYEKIKDYITLGRNIGFNPNTAPIPVLKAVLNIGDSEVEKVENYLKNGTIFDNNTLFNLTGKQLINEEGIYFYPSQVFIVKIFVKNDDKFNLYKKLIIDTRGNLTQPYTIINED
ncbi:MAG: general secretion pathway protein GspK [Sulfurihydrogenibium sp.]